MSAKPMPSPRDLPDQVRIVRTVCGDRAVADFGAVMVHEHVLFDITPPGTTAVEREAPITLQNRWQVDYLSNATASNARQQDRAAAAAELAAFAADGGDLIIDQSVGGLARDPEGLRAASEASGCAVVACAGIYTAAYMDEATLAADTDELTEHFIGEVETGLDGTAIRAGLIGEIGCSWPLQDSERRALQAAARAARATGAGLSVHPGRDPRAPFEIVEILAREGADLARTVICHMDRTYPEGRDIDGYGPAALAATGVMVEWDFFGIETSHYWMGDVELPTDRMRLRSIRAMFDAGLGNNVLISHDICTRTRLTHWGGHGYGHILRNIRPLMSRLGFSALEIARLVRDNPLRLLAMPMQAPQLSRPTEIMS
jgi:phosphotriesterase-related protein